MNELIDYFVKMGMSPEVAVQLAGKVGVMTPPDPPIANGVKMNDLTELLTTRYRLNPAQATAYAGQVLSGTAPQSKELIGEVQSNNLDRVANTETTRLKDIAAYAKAAKIPEMYRSAADNKDYGVIDRQFKAKLKADAMAYQNKAVEDEQTKANKDFETKFGPSDRGSVGE